MTAEMNYIHCCALLEVRPDATLPEIQRAHRRLVLIWHPDRFLPGSELHAEAEVRIRSIGKAYEFLRNESEKRSLRRGAVDAASPAETESASRKENREVDRAGVSRSLPLCLGAFALVVAVIFGLFLLGPKPDSVAGTRGPQSSAPPPVASEALPARMDFSSDAQPFVVSDQCRTVLVFLPPRAELENHEGSFIRACELFRLNVANVRHELRRSHPEVSVQVIDAAVMKVGGQTVHRKKTRGYGYILFEAPKAPLIIEGMPSTEELRILLNKYFFDEVEGRNP
ncbi:MAG: heat shock protein DnaJ domain protein [Holophagaceae bacterium]|nr:heat shock protein DnaJ domain protein [Holophagaceae bacterium]